MIKSVFVVVSFAAVTVAGAVAAPSQDANDPTDTPWGMASSIEVPAEVPAGLG